MPRPLTRWSRSRSDEAGSSPDDKTFLGQIVAHTGLRGFAALCVVGYHLQFGAGYRLPIERATQFLHRSYLFVDLFFILSGFIMCYTNVGRGLATVNGRTAISFYAARIARIYPLHAVCLAYFGAAALAFSGLRYLSGAAVSFPADLPGSGAGFIAQAALVQSWLPQAVSWNIPSWSISAEMSVYALFPAIVWTRRQVPVAYRLVLIAIPAMFYTGIGVTTRSLDIVYGLAPLRCLSGFLVGMAIYEGRGGVDRLSARTLASLQIVAGVGIVAGLCFTIDDVWLVPAFALLAGTTWRDRGPLARLFGSRALQRAGVLSYSIYLNHVCLFWILDRCWSRLSPHAHLGNGVLRLAMLAVYATLLLLLSAVTYRYVEKPARSHLLRRWSSREMRLPSAVPTAP